MEDQLNRIERKLNYLILVSARPDFWLAFGEEYKGGNALAAYEDIIKGRPTYLNDHI